jgi:hypothetical protein
MGGLLWYHGCLGDMPSIALDDRRWPLLVVSFDGLAGNEEFDRYLTELGQYANRGETWCAIFDATRSVGAPASHRRKMAQWIKNHESALARHSAGAVFVIRSSLVRGVLTAIFWLQPLPHAHAIVSTLEEAETWAKTRLASRAAQNLESRSA